MYALAYEGMRTPTTSFTGLAGTNFETGSTPTAPGAGLFVIRFRAGLDMGVILRIAVR